MKIEQAIKILTEYNAWRRGFLDEIKYTPTQIGIALDKVIEFSDKCIKAIVKNKPNE